MASPVRRLAVAFALAFALVSGQVAGWVHAFSHVADQLSRHGDAVQANGACEQCAFFANLAAGAAPHAEPVVPTSPVVEAAIPAPRTIATREALAYRSRAPPAFL